MSRLDRFLCWIGIHDQFVRKRLIVHERGYVRKVEVTNCARCGRKGYVEEKHWDIPE